MARLLVSDTIKLDPIDYDLYKGGLRYFHGGISREEAIARLSQRQEDGYEAGSDFISNLIHF